MSKEMYPFRNAFIARKPFQHFKVWTLAEDKEVNVLRQEHKRLDDIVNRIFFHQSRSGDNEYIARLLAEFFLNGIDLRLRILVHEVLDVECVRDELNIALVSHGTSEVPQIGRGRVHKIGFGEESHEKRIDETRFVLEIFYRVAVVQRKKIFHIRIPHLEEKRAERRITGH